MQLYISAIISGLVAGLTLQQSQVLGNLAGALAVTSQHTIHPAMSREGLKSIAENSNIHIEPRLLDLLNAPVNQPIKNQRNI